MSYISDNIRKLVSQRANHRCEYCRFHEDDFFITFTVEHIYAKKHGGGSELSNLANACPHCNQHKGTDLTTFLDDYQDIEILFNPRLHHWNDHFEVDFGEILPKTRIGRATIKLLQFNKPELIILRRELMAVDRFP